MHKKIFFLLCFILTALAVMAEDPVFTNQDVLGMVKAGLSDDVIIKKIKEAPKVDFRMGRDDLKEFYNLGVHHPIFQAMFERTLPPAPDGNMMRALGMEFIEVSLKRGEENVPMPFIHGVASRGGFLGGKTVSAYTGIHAQARTTERLPIFLVKRSTSPLLPNFYLVRLDLGEKDNARFLKMSARQFTVPDSEKTIPYDVTQEREGLWRVTPKQHLEPGEYGWYQDITAGPQGAGLFAFGVD